MKKIKTLIIFLLFFVYPLNATPDWMVDPADQGSAFFGRSIALGDINGDGYSDVIIGAPGLDNDSVNEGRVYVYYGSPSGLPAIPDWFTDPADQSDASFGRAVSSGDVNGDGYYDVIVGAPRYTSDASMEGRVYLFYGNISGPSTVPDWLVDPTNQSYSYFGSSVASGDINGDGFLDIIIGAPGWDEADTNEGRVYVYYGSSSGPSSAPDWIADPVNQKDAYFGSSVSSGDVNGDGFSDIIIGADEWDGEAINEGRVYVYYGSPSGPSAVPDWTADPTDQQGASFGTSITSADINGDGYDDIIIGAPYWNGEATDEGRVYVYLGSPSGPANTPDWFNDPADQRAYFGQAVSSGDVNGDGFSDVIIGANFWSGEATYEGRIYLYLGSTSGLSSVPEWMDDPTNQFNSNFGQSLASGNVNGDNYFDIIVGAPSWDGEASNEGRVYGYYGSVNVEEAGIDAGKTEFFRNNFSLVSGDKIVLRLPENLSGSFLVSLYGTSGNLIFSKRISSTGLVVLRDRKIKELSSGVYFLSIFYKGKEPERIKLIKK